MFEFVNIQQGYYINIILKFQRKISVFLTGLTDPFISSPRFWMRFIPWNFSSRVRALVNRHTVKTAFCHTSKHYVQFHQSCFGYHVSTSVWILLRSRFNRWALVPFTDTPRISILCISHFSFANNLKNF